MKEQNQHIRTCHHFISELLEEHNLTITHASTQPISGRFSHHTNTQDKALELLAPYRIYILVIHPN